MLRNLLLVSLVFLTSCKGWQDGPIFYRLSTEVYDELDRYLDEFSNLKDSDFAAKMYKDGDGNYVITLLNLRSQDSKDKFSLVNEKIIQKSNRYLSIKNIKIPIFTPLDLALADVGTVKSNSGREGRPAMIMFLDGFTITFNSSGDVLNVR